MIFFSTKIFLDIANPYESPLLMWICLFGGSIVFVRNLSPGFTVKKKLLFYFLLPIALLLPNYLGIKYELYSEYFFFLVITPLIILTIPVLVVMTAGYSKIRPKPLVIIFLFGGAGICLLILLVIEILTPIAIIESNTYVDKIKYQFLSKITGKVVVGEIQEQEEIKKVLSFFKNGHNVLGKPFYTYRCIDRIELSDKYGNLIGMYGMTMSKIVVNSIDGNMYALSDTRFEKWLYSKECVNSD